MDECHWLERAWKAVDFVSATLEGTQSASLYRTQCDLVQAKACRRGLGSASGPAGGFIAPSVAVAYVH
jgi:hypothetical protein